MGVRAEQSRRWVRGYLGGEVVVDTREPLLFWEEGFPTPSYAIARPAIREGALRPVPVDGRDHPFFGPHGPVSAVYDVATGARSASRAAWVRDDPALDGHVVFSWEPGVFDKWTEEDVEVFGHPRDPHHRVDALPSSRRVRVEIDGELLAESGDTVVLFETGLPTRYYLPPDSVVSARLTPTDHVTHCPYKGAASKYWNHPALANIAWSYPHPDPSVAAIAGRIAFYDEFVDVTVDGEPQERPVSTFSRARP